MHSLLVCDNCKIVGDSVIANHPQSDWVSIIFNGRPFIFCNSDCFNEWRIENSLIFADELETSMPKGTKADA